MKSDYLNSLYVVLLILLAMSLFGWCAENWRISLPVIIAVSVGVLSLYKLYNYHKKKERKRERDMESQAAREFCKDHPNIKNPIKYEIIPLKRFCKSFFKTYFRWDKFGRAYIKSKGGEQPSVVVYDIEKEVKYNSFGYANKPIDSYEIPIFNMKSDFED